MVFSMPEHLADGAGRNQHEAVGCENSGDSDISPPKIALVGLGGAGTSIVKMVIEDGRIGEMADVYVVNTERLVENVKLYRFEEIDQLAEELSNYRHVILTAGLGSSGGRFLVYLANRLENVTVFVARPFRVERVRYKRAEEQLRSLRHEAIVKDLEELLERMPGERVDIALDVFDGEIAGEIVDRVMGLYAGGGMR